MRRFLETLLVCLIALLRAESHAIAKVDSKHMVSPLSLDGHLTDIILSAKSSKGKLGKKTYRKVKKVYKKRSSGKRPPPSISKKRSKPRHKKRSKATYLFGHRIPMPPSTIIRILNVVFFVALLIYHRRLEALGAAPQRFVTDAKSVPVNHEAKEVFLDKNHGPDPYANKTAGVRLSIGETAIEDINLDNDTNADCAVDLAQAVSAHGSPIGLRFDASNPAMKPTSQAPKGTNLDLPGDMGLHFQGMPAENKLWQGQWSIPLVSTGHLVITNKRILSTYYRTSFKLLPPFTEHQYRRHQSRIANIATCESAAIRRPSFLVAGMLLGAWLPVGTIASIFCLVAYLFINRTEFGIELKNHHMRTYPLDAGDLEEAMEAINSFKKERADKINKAKAS